MAEAVDVLDTQMLALASRGLGSVRVLTGTGHHSKGPTNRVNVTTVVTPVVSGVVPAILVSLALVVQVK